MTKASAVLSPQPQKKEETQQSRKSSPKSTEPVMDLLGLGKNLSSVIAAVTMTIHPSLDLVSAFSTHFHCQVHNS